MGTATALSKLTTTALDPHQITSDRSDRKILKRRLRSPEEAELEQPPRTRRHPPEGGAVVPATKRKPQWAGAAGPARKRRQSPRVINGALEATCVVCFVLMSNEVIMPLYGPVYPPQANDPEPVGSGGG